MSVNLGKGTGEGKDNPESFFKRNKALINLGIILLIIFSAFKGCTALMDHNREKAEARQVEKQKEKAAMEAEKEEEKKAKEEKDRQTMRNLNERQASNDRAKAIDKDLNAASQGSTVKALTQEDCDTIASENEMMTKSINEGNNNRKNSSEYLKLQKKVSICQKQGMIE
ncbi:hypothetical protein PDK35_02565 [Bacillus cereus group sp. TH153LC]|uniref:hypothetical protein n=1 Tax=Bacillus cereus group sp. TH153LC TaxID=3018059 RepID=UPI0022E17EF2|nr:hypothetical protein [Bacillus cereus group sp. TH153LC]MDA1658859.1 hypothetical protein [Bacillus cereus group sp. TH153LC]